MGAVDASKKNKIGQMENIRYLEQREKCRSRNLYETAFPEDSKEFVDYYYKWKTRENNILVMENERGEIQVMMHLNPYQIHINDCLQKVPYIVAVATHSDCRRQGKMRKVMERALQDMAREQIPFTFLLPADAAYYEGQGFVFFPCQKTEGESAAEPDWNWRSAEAEDIPKMAAFSNRVLKEHCHIFIQRDSLYYQRLMAETEVEDGGILISEYQGKINGILVYGTEICEAEVPVEGTDLMAASTEEGRKCAEIKELLLDSDLSQEETKSLCQSLLPDCGISLSDFRMMVRITSLESFVPMLRRETSLSLKVRVKDDMVEANHGCYQIEIDSRGGKIERILGTAGSVQDSSNSLENFCGNCFKEMDISELSLILLEEVQVNLREWV